MVTKVQDKDKQINFLFKLISRMTIFIMFIGFLSQATWAYKGNLTVLGYTMWLATTAVLGYVLFYSFKRIPTLVERGKK